MRPGIHRVDSGGEAAEQWWGKARKTYIPYGIQSYLNSGTVRTETRSYGARRVQSYLFRRHDWIPN